MTRCTSTAPPDPAPRTVATTDVAGPDFPFVDAGSGGATIIAGDDWSLPSRVRPAANSGFFSEDASANDHVLVRSVDFSWRQIHL